MKKLFLFSLFLFFSTQVNAVSLENYCFDGYYKIPNEKVCSRAPKCGGKSYDEVASLPAPNPQECMGDKDGQRIGCQGYVPLCCYEVARTGDPTMCVGYWERLWCHPDQCSQIDLDKGRECNNGNRGNCSCGHAFKSWCKGADAPNPPVPLETRLGLKLQTSTPTPFSTIKPINSPKTEPIQFFTPILITPTPTKTTFDRRIFPLPTSSYQYKFPTVVYPQIASRPASLLRPGFFLSDVESMTEKIKIIYQEKIKRIKKEIQTIKEPVVSVYFYIKGIDSQFEQLINGKIIDLFNQLKQFRIYELINF